MTIWAVQIATGGIPEEPVLFAFRSHALRYYLEQGVAAGLPFNGVEFVLGDGKTDVRMWAVELAGPRVDPTLSDAQRKDVENMLRSALRTDAHTDSVAEVKDRTDHLQRLNTTDDSVPMRLNPMGGNGAPKARKEPAGIPCLYDPPLPNHHVTGDRCAECSKVRAVSEIFSALARNPSALEKTKPGANPGRGPLSSSEGGSRQ